MPFYYLCRPLRYYVCRESGGTVACRLSACFISHTVPAAAAATVQWQQQQQQQVESGKNFVSVLWRLELFATCFPALPLPLLFLLLLLPQGLPASVCVCVCVCVLHWQLHILSCCCPLAATCTILCKCIST